MQPPRIRTVDHIRSKHRFHSSKCSHQYRMSERKLDIHGGTLDVHGALHDGDVLVRDGAQLVHDVHDAQVHDDVQDHHDEEQVHDDAPVRDVQDHRDAEVQELMHDAVVHDLQDENRALLLVKNDVNLHCYVLVQLNGCHLLYLLEQNDYHHLCLQELKNAAELLLHYHHYVNAVRMKLLT